MTPAAMRERTGIDDAQHLGLAAVCSKDVYCHSMIEVAR